LKMLLLEGECTHREEGLSLSVQMWLEGECINMEERLSLEGEIVGYSSVSLSPTLGKNEKVKQHIKKKTHKHNVLRFWVESGVIPLCVFGPVLILVRSPCCFSP